MKLFEKIRINLENGCSRQVRVCGIPVFQYDRTINDDKVIKTQYLPFLKKKKNDNSKPVFYLKVNRNEDYTFLCLQHWIDVVNHIGADYYIICDKKQLEIAILKRIKFKNSKIKFLKSYKNRELKNIVKNIATKNWKKAAYAHLTTFAHARQNNIENFWNIDADDTLFCTPPESLAHYLRGIELYADSNNIDAFSLDMHRSRTRGKHWSFGVTYTRTNIDWFNLFNKNQNTDWRKNYLNYDDFSNLDWFFTYLKDEKNIKNETFYIDRLSFIHWGNFLTNIIGSGVFNWQNDELTFPVILNIIENEYYGRIPIAKDCIKIPGNITEKDNNNFITDYVTYLTKPSKQVENLWSDSTN